MCGIAGAIGRIDQAIIDAVVKMNERQVHRGPDGCGLWHTPEADGDGAVVAHRRLAIIDLTPAGAQPMVDDDTGNVIAFNGEIYNFRELRDELEREGVSFASRCDTEVLLKAYGRWGEKCVQRLRGMFAFAIWDAQRRCAFLARDRLGIKPLYYAHCRDGLTLFASEVRALLAGGMIPRRLDPEGLESFVWNGFVVGPGTIVKGVRLLPAGATMRIDASGAIDGPKRFWRLPAPGEGDGDPDALGAALAESVRMRLVSDVPLGVFLSGGVDSSSVAALAMRAADAPVRTFNIAFDEAEFDESPYARAVAEALGTDHVEVRLNQRMFVDHLEDALASVDQPTFDAINTYFVSRAVREAGITVALSGAGGDEVFGGYYTFADILRTRRWGRALRAVPEPMLRGLAGAVARAKCGRFGEAPPQVRWGKLGDGLAVRGRMVDLYQVSYGLFTSAFYEQLLADPPRGGALGLPDAFADELDELIGDRAGLHEISQLLLMLYMGQRLLRDTDGSSMAVSLEVRVPLLDHHVIEQAARIDPQMRFHPLGRKQLLRDLALDGLDRSLFERPRSGFVLPIGVWCREQLSDAVGATLQDAGLCASAGLNADTVARLWRAFQAGAPGLYWSRIWALYSVLWWCRRHEVTV